MDIFDFPTFELQLPSKESLIKQFKSDQLTSNVQEILTIPESEAYFIVDTGCGKSSSREEVTDEVLKYPQCSYSFIVQHLDQTFA